MPNLQLAHLTNIITKNQCTNKLHLQNNNNNNHCNHKVEKEVKKNILTDKTYRTLKGI